MERCEESSRIISKYHDKIPVICEVSPSADIKLKITTVKYLVPRDLTVGQLAYVIRKRLELPPEKAMFIMIDNMIVPPTAALVSDIYSKHKDSDGFAYFSVCFENFFGA
jgi:GABA(A) receptor-associated protein